LSSRTNCISCLTFTTVITLFLLIIASVSINGIGLNSPNAALAQQQQQPQTNLTSVEQQQLMDGISFEIDNVTFSHHTTSVNGIQLHYVIGGQGDPIVLLHGWPETWWVIFHQTRDVPEALVQGKEMMYLSWFFHNLAYNPAAITQESINEYVSHYSAPGGMRAGFEHYKAFPEDAIQNQNYSKTKLTMPVLALGGGYIPTFGGNITMPTVIYGMNILAQNVQGITVPNSGHFIPEEQPDVVVKLLSNFFSGNSTTSSK
jgi:pimeloyl-ACP methyl ester carboxylesterase